MEATNGLEGYVYRDELDEATGINMSSPEEALKWQRQTAGTTVDLPVYESDGSTLIGEFVIQRPTLVEIENSVKDFAELELGDG